MRKLFIKTDATPNRVVIFGHSLEDGQTPILVGGSKMVGGHYSVHACYNGGIITTITTVVPYSKTLRVRVTVDSFKASEVAEIESLIIRLEGLEVTTHTAMVQREITTWHLVE